MAERAHKQETHAREPHRSPALIALVRALARQAAREFYYAHYPPEAPVDTIPARESTD